MAIALVLLRAFAVLASFQLAGLGHLAGDLVEEVTLGHHHDTRDEPDDDPDQQCPPGCPNCHHAHHSAAPAPSALPTSSSQALVVTVQPPLLTEGRPPTGPSLPSVYRPPRA